MFKQIGAVEVTQSMLIAGKMGGHPIHNHANAGLVQTIDQKHKILGCTVTRTWGKVSGGLIPPGTVKGVFGGRHKLHMGKADVTDIAGKPFGQFTITQVAVAFLWHPSPGAEMKLIDYLRGIQAVYFAAPRHPLLILPVIVELPDP